MKSNQQLKREARASFANEIKNFSVIGGYVVKGVHFTFPKAHLDNKRWKNITTSSIRLENNREKIPYKKQLSK
jgi:hypothetical protein